MLFWWFNLLQLGAKSLSPPNLKSPKIKTCPLAAFFSFRKASTTHRHRFSCRFATLWSGLKRYLLFQICLVGHWLPFGPCPKCIMCVSPTYRSQETGSHQRVSHIYADTPGVFFFLSFTKLNVLFTTNFQTEYYVIFFIGGGWHLPIKFTYTLWLCDKWRHNYDRERIKNLHIAALVLSS